MSWLFFAILAPAVIGITNFFDRFLLEKRIKNPAILIILAGFMVTIFGFGFWVWQDFAILSFKSTFLLLFSGLMYELALMPYYKAISIDDVSRIVPLFQVIPIFILIFSFIFIGEKLNAYQLIGFFLVLGGGMAISIKNFNKKIFVLRKSFWYMMLSGLMYAIPFVIFKFVVMNENFWVTIPYEFFGAGIASLILLLNPKLRTALIQTFKTVSLSTFSIFSSNELIYAIGKILNFYATSLAAVSLVSVIGGTQSFFVLIYGLILSLWFPKIIKEDIRKKTIILKLAAMVVIFIGVWYINKT